MYKGLLLLITLGLTACVGPYYEPIPDEVVTDYQCVDSPPEDLGVMVNSGVIV